MYIRYFADTDPDSPISHVALAFLPSLLRVASVRVIDPGRMIPGIPDGAWARRANLFHTPMVGEFVNVVCCPPARWTWTQTIEAPKSNSRDAEYEKITGRLELHTSGVRNILIIASAPTEAPQYATALKYNVLLTHLPLIAAAWPPGAGIYPSIIPIPVTGYGHSHIRQAILGTNP